MTDVIVLAGGIIPHDDYDTLRKMGLRGVFGPGTYIKDIVESIKQATEERISN